MTIATTYTVMGYFLPYHINRLKHIHPYLEVNIHELDRSAVEEGLIAKRFDLAVILTSNINNPELETETLFRSPRRLWIDNNHPFAQQRKVSMTEIAKQDYIALTVDEAADTATKYWNLHQVQPKIKLRTSSVEAVRSMVANGQGVTILSDMVYRPWSLEGKRILTVETDAPIPSMDVGLAWCRGSQFNHETKLIYEYFRQAFISPHA